jgi:calcineurin-like phosphoesterase family protein
VRFFTADLHLGHRNIIRYCDRPFADVDEMNRALIDGWNDAVGDDDEVLLLGDFALGQIAQTLPLADRLRGRKVLLAGNHDRCWTGHGPAARKWTQQYLDAGFDEIWQGTVPLDLGGTEVLVSHFPYEGDSQDLDRHLSHRPEDNGGWLLHGHVHDEWKVRGRMINVGVDVWDYRPLSEDALAELIAAPRA